VDFGPLKQRQHGKVSKSPPEERFGGLLAEESAFSSSLSRTMPILISPRFSFEPPRLESEPVRRVRAAWISDVHLGTRGSNAAALLDFLREYEFETLYVVGDLIDVWQLRRGIY
jgi:hypothetical protein